ncbi:YSIRK signal domain/LPXTG anchor domain surface protein [Staphylococcus haemolyticus]|uniref:SasC/FmtB family protein n=1 Tax=Staphylococcus haemolyticus TaxID=1283 RepID=UPI000D1F9C80|nr:SasC/FmtB family protein [Staphylococcus haemolyticus]PTK74670.1 YSIRK signal domain/LPXTG anchor domain surface protein [Staphylococcus haemolyticus]
MNLFKKQKFSIRKFTVGTFSTVIATLAFITHTGHAAELDEHSQSAQQKITESKNTEDLNQHQSDAIKDSSKSESKINANPTLNKEAVSETTEVPNKTQTTNSTENKNSTEISDKDIDKSKVKGNNVDTNQPILDNNESNKNSKSAPTHKRVKRDANDATSNTQTQQDPMAINETNSGQIINGNFTDTSNGAEIPTAATESAMDEASKIPGWKVVNSQQTQIPLVWGPKVLPSYTYITFDKTNNKIGAVLSKYSYNLSYGRPDNSVGPIYQDIDVTPGSELQFHYLGSSIGNISGFNSARMFIYDANNPSTLLYKGTPKTSSQPFGIFKGVFNVPENISRIRLQFESLVNVSHDTYNGHRLLKGPNNFGGGVVADVSVNTGAYLKVSAAQTEYQANSTSNSSPDVNAKLNVSIENKGHSSSNKTQYKVVLPEGVTFVSAENATGTFNEDTRELTLNINPINAGTTRDISYTVSLPTTVPIKKDFNANLIYQTEGINMNRQNGSRDLAVQTPGDNNYLRYGGNNEFIITESDQRQGSTIAPTQSVTVNMYKDAINSKISEIETELAQVNQNDYSTEAWNNLQTALTNAKVVKNETDATPLTDRKNQAEINKLLLNLEKAKAKFDIDKAAKARESVINSNTEATTEEKQAALTKLQNKFNENKAEIDKLTISNDIAPLKESSISQINSINVTATKKAEEKQAIEAALTQRKVFIDGHYDATQEEKDVALAKIDEAAKQAKAAIDAATTNNAVDEAITNNTTIISGILPETVKKAAARKAIDDAATAKKEAINNTPDATQEEKDEAIEKVDAAVSAAKQAITQATTNDSVDQEQTNGNNTIASIQPEVTKKAAARKAIDDEVVAKKAAIDTVADATDEEKQAAKDKVDAEATKAKAAIDRANTNSDVEQAKSSSVSTIEAIQPETIKKSSAKRAIDDSANAKKAAIDNNSDATQEEKDAAKAKVDAEVTKAKAAIDQATTNDGVDQAKDLGNNAISIIQPDVVKKVAARKAIDDAATAKKQEIDQHPTATQEEKEAAKAKVDAEVQKAKDAINQANSNNDVDQVQNSETATIAGIQVDAVKKATAKQAIDVALAAKKQEIDNNENATQEEKEAAKTKVDEEATKAKATIDQASTNSDVEQAKSTGEATISSIQPEVVKKSEAKQAIDDAVTAKKAEIDQNQEATKEEKDAAKAKVDEEATKAKAAISQASTNNDVDQAKTSSVTTISSIQPEIVKKAEAKKAIEDEVIAKKAEIDQNQEATKEEKDAAKAKVDEEATKAKQAIDNATTNESVDQAKNQGVTTITSIQPETNKKADAKRAIDEVAKAKKQEIDSNINATKEEKDVAKSKVDEEVTKAKNVIDQATTNDQVDQGNNNGYTAITAIQPETVKKPEAKQAIDEVAKAKKDLIDQTPNATKEEKDAAKAKVDEEVTKAKKAIDQASTNSDVDQVKDKGTNDINSVVVEVLKKDEAKKAIDDLVKAKKSAIDSNHNATKEEKEAAKAKVDDEAKKAKDIIDQGTTNNEVDQTKNSSSNIIKNIQPETIKKSVAKQTLLDQAKAKKAEIDNNNNATKEEKDAAKAEVDKIIDKANKAIDNANTNDDVDKVQVNFTTKLKEVKVKIVKKPEAQKIILEVANKQKDKIDQLVGLTDEQRNKAKYLIDEIVRKALDKLNKDITNKDVDSILNKAIEDIEKVNPTVSKGKQVLPRDNNDGRDRNNNNKLGNNSSTNPSSKNKSNKLPSTGEESQRQSPLAGFALISGLFLFLKNRKRNKENN